MNAEIVRPRAADPAYLRFTAPDADVMKTFPEDFGLIVQSAETDVGEPILFSRGTDLAPYVHIVERGEPRFAGLVSLMSSREDLVALADMEGASSLQPLTAPGGGEIEHFTDGDLFSSAVPTDLQRVESLLAIHWGARAALHRCG
ncbi:MAG: hypothetical protein AAGG55_02950 [Pseudomonadota bacterium]